ncbi:MAG: hemolysin III family protein [Gemmatimonadota bacterium]
MAPPLRPLTPGEEIANSVSHGIGLAAILVGIPFLLVPAIRRASTIGAIGLMVFATSIVLLYLASTLYHALRHEGAKNVLQLIDHGAIYLLIAGTYTPFLLGVLRGTMGWTLLGVVWTLALAGVILKTAGRLAHPALSLALYLAMGWLIVVAARPLVTHVPTRGLLLLAAGGLAYTGGVLFFVAERRKYSHFIWHLCVLAGTTCHFFAVLWYA